MEEQNIITLFRFEDKHGMFDIFCLSRGIDRKSIERTKLYKIEDSIFIDADLCISNVLRISREGAATYKRLGIERVIFVYDVDSMTAGINKVMTKNQFMYGGDDISSNEGMEITKENLDSFGITYLFMPVTYCAESVGLLEYYNKFHVESIVSTTNTTKLHLYLLLANCRSKLPGKRKPEKETKVLHDHVNIDTVKNNLMLLTNSYLNGRLYSWILSGCSLDESYYLNYEEAIKYIEDVNNIFYNLLNNPIVDSVQVGNTEFNILDDFEVLRSKLKHYKE